MRAYTPPNPHTALLRTIREYLEYQGAYVVNNMGGMGSKRGIWDLTAAGNVSKETIQRYIAAQRGI